MLVYKAFFRSSHESEAGSRTQFLQLTHNYPHNSKTEKNCRYSLASSIEIWNQLDTFHDFHFNPIIL